MAKLSVGKSLINVEQNIKDDAMRPTICILGFVLTFSTVLILFGHMAAIQYFGMFAFAAAIIYALYLNIFFAHNDADRLHTERYLINKKMLEMGMVENRQGNILEDNATNTLPPDSPLYLADNTEDIQEVEE